MSRVSIGLDNYISGKILSINDLRAKSELVYFALRELVRTEDQKSILALDGKSSWHGDLDGMRRSIYPTESQTSGLTPRQQTKYRHIAKCWAAPVYFIRGYIFKGGFLDGAVGLHFALGKTIYFYQIRSKISERIFNGE